MIQILDVPDNIIIISSILKIYRNLNEFEYRIALSELQNFNEYFHEYRQKYTDVSS